MVVTQRQHRVQALALAVSERIEVNGVTARRAHDLQHLLVKFFQGLGIRVYQAREDE